MEYKGMDWILYPWGGGGIQNGLNHRTYGNYGDFLKHISQPFIILEI